MPLLYNILYKPKEKMTQTVKFSTRRCVPFRCVGGEKVVCLIRTPTRGVIAKRDKTSRFMGGSPRWPLGYLDPHTRVGCDVTGGVVPSALGCFDPHTRK